MQKYESIFIGQPELSVEDFQSLLQTYEQLIQKDGGTVVRAETWGKKRLAYTVQKHDEGYFGFLLYEGTGAIVKELERKFRLHEDVIKFLSVLAPPEGARIIGGMEIRPPRPEDDAGVETTEKPSPLSPAPPPPAASPPVPAPSAALPPAESPPAESPSAESPPAPTPPAPKEE